MTEYTLALLSDITTVSTGLADHLADTVGAHAATAISFTPAGGIAATTVQAAIEEAVSDASALFQPLDAGLTDIAALAVTDGNIIVGDGANWVAESGATARTSLGLGVTSTPEFDGLTISHVTNGISVGLGTDVDVAIFQASVATGSPAFSWDTSSDMWRSNRGLIIDANGVGDGSHTIAGASVLSQIELHSEGTAALGGLAIHRHSDTANFGGHLLFLKSGGTHGSPTVPADQDVIGYTIAAVFDGTDYELSSAIQHYVDGTVSNNVAPGGMRFFTNAGSQTLVEWLEVGADQIAIFANSPLVGANAVIDAGDAATTSAQGIVELAIASELNTGTDATRAVTPDALAGSSYGTAIVEIECFSNSENTATGDDAADGYWRVPSELNGWNLVGVAAHVGTAGTTNTTDIQIHNVTQAADMLSTKITIDSGETDSSTAATPAVIDTGNDDVATGDKIRIDVDAVSTTPAQGLVVTLQFRLP